MMTQRSIIKLFEAKGALLSGHFAYEGKLHGDMYVNKDAIYPYRCIHNLCEELASRLPEKKFFDVEAVVAPALGGIILSRLIADSLSERFETEILAVYAEKERDRFAFRRGYDKLIDGKKVMIADDIMTTGESVRKVAEAARLCGAEILGAAVLWNRGKVSAKNAGVTHLFALVKHSFDSWTEEECPLCKHGVPVDTKHGHGAEFYIRKMQKDIVKATNRAVQEVFGEKKK